MHYEPAASKTFSRHILHQPVLLATIRGLYLCVTRENISEIEEAEKSGLRMDPQVSDRKNTANARIKLEVPKPKIKRERRRLRVKLESGNSPAKEKKTLGGPILEIRSSMPNVSSVSQPLFSILNMRHEKGIIDEGEEPPSPGSIFRPCTPVTERKRLVSERSSSETSGELHGRDGPAARTRSRRL